MLKLYTPVEKRTYIEYTSLEKRTCCIKGVNCGCIHSFFDKVFAKFT